MAAYTLYELLRTLIERVGWPSEQEKMAALESVREAEGMGLLGNLAVMMKCRHENVDRPYKGTPVCRDCGGRVE